MNLPYVLDGDLNKAELQTWHHLCDVTSDAVATYAHIPTKIVCYNHRENNSPLTAAALRTAFDPNAEIETPPGFGRIMFIHSFFECLTA